MNSDLSGSSIPRVEKAGVLVVTSASSWSHRCSLPEGFWYLEVCRAGVARNAVALNEQCWHTVWKELFSNGELSSCSSLLLLSLKCPFCMIQQIVSVLALA